MPRIYLGEPSPEKMTRYNVIQVEKIKIYSSPRLKVKEGDKVIRIILKKALFLKWLEIEGAMGIVSLH
ncbi:hypothetical protein DESME_04430 [Desulfitobacterium metallireducens DSM 15288]|uniref:Uncharacterized protein n=1 Tax=Desulfitobacterium metallireducens DSM 15288 TaxID=871968 RepID=W0EG25_9FIRM|nr:hypothetical protein [Desulfitobacterium metallireducens]AHF08473.1 hypothetical protein DESME_04430 [Desulfitobacterium metallireducens DSM 15288]